MKKYLGLGLFAGLLVGVVIALLREVLDVTVRTVDTATALVKAPVIGTIDHDNGAKKQPLIVGSAANSPRAEAFRQVRTNLRYIDSAQQTDVLLVTSSVPVEGKSTVAADLALVLAESGSRTLLIDGDLRRPTVADLFGLEPAIGLTSVLVGQVTANDAIQRFGATDLDVLTAGGLPPNPAELLGGERMHRLVTELRRVYDKIIIDAPPLLPVADAGVATSLVDGVLFVIRHGKTSRATVADSARTLHSIDARIVGTVLNMRRLSRRQRRDYSRDSYLVLDTAGRTPVNDLSGGNVEQMPSHALKRLQTQPTKVEV
jgi:capsular exopolysaccharide synthesis family protein